LDIIAGIKQKVIDVKGFRSPDAPLKNRLSFGDQIAVRPWRHHRGRLLRGSSRPLLTSVMILLFSRQLALDDNHRRLDFRSSVAWRHRDAVGDRRKHPQYS